MNKEKKLYTLHERQNLKPMLTIHDMNELKSKMKHDENGDSYFDESDIIEFGEKRPLRADWLKALSSDDIDLVEKGRLYVPEDDMMLEPNLETTQTTRLADGIPCHDASQRQNMKTDQINAAVMPIFAETPDLASCLGADILTRSSCVRKATGRIKLIDKFIYQFRSIYVYELNGVFDILDTDGYIDSNGHSCVSKSDLDQLIKGEETDISQDNFLLEYPIQYNPTADTIGLGVNVRCICNTSVNNSGDPAPVSESFLAKFASLKYKNINLHLNNKKIISKYPKLFPEIGEVVEENIIFKIVDNDGLISEITQSPSQASGDENEVIVAPPGTFINSITVICNNKIENEVLEEYRQSYLRFRREVHICLDDIVNTHGYRNCSSKLLAYKDNFAHELFRSDTKPLSYPLIQMKLVTINIPGEGSKFSNMHGGKYTVQKIIRDDMLVDEFGRTIELEYPSTAIINRTVAGIPWELAMTSFLDFLEHKVMNDEVDKQTAYDFMTKMYEALEMSEEWAYTGFTPDLLEKYIKSGKHLKIITMPYSNKLDLDTYYYKIYEVAVKMIGYKKLTIYRRVGKDEYVPMTDPHVVGRMYTIVDYHDTEYGNSGCGEPELNSQGFPDEKDVSKKNARRIFANKAVKMDVQFQWIALNTLHNETAMKILADPEDESSYAILEVCEAAGVKLQLGTDKENLDLLFGEED